MAEKSTPEAPVTSTTVIHPANVTIGHPATFGVSTKIPRPYQYHWQKNGKIFGAPSEASYSTPPVASEDFGTQYSVTVFGAGGEVETSPAVTLTKPK